MSSATTSSSALPSSSVLPDTAEDTKRLIAATVVTVVCLVLIGLSLFLVIRLGVRRRKATQTELPSRKSTAVDPSHIAAQITPYGSASKSKPHFDHRPGSDMRIAIRRPDGAWDFAHPGSPFNPAGVREIELTPHTPGPSSSIPPTPTTPKSPVELMKERESKAARLIRKGYDDREFDADPDCPPPPAYGQEPGYLDHTKDPYERV
ncbi:hypothetical protein AMATHDRAFT_50336 [Amanita thiersii Skay4041]|uniref:Uncharacterized protein n=1 Tax=Amanita thiersii Skay4041 TaxID=703135 RepID=A0A2A9NIB9_9AGAR|nr:hypothetical protein AMATHDRAFT_50336 [Amanita thiersii Skay4041]